MQFTDVSKVKKDTGSNGQGEQGMLNQLKRKINAGMAAKKGQKIGVA